MTTQDREVAGVAASAPLPVPDWARRRDRLRARLADVGADLLLVTHPHNVRYLSGFRGSNGQFLLAPDAADDRLVTDERYEERAAVEAPALTVILSRVPFDVAVRAAVTAGGALGVEAHHVSWDAGERLREQAGDHPVVRTRGLVERLRAVKDDAEVARLARACGVTTAALDWLLHEAVAAGRSERELAVALERRFVDLGADGAGFDSIVASGPNAAVPHHEPTMRRLGPGDVLTIDCGAVVDGYHADCTRTVAVGHLDDPLTRAYDTVREAQRCGRDAAHDGIDARDVDRAAREVVERAGLGDRFVHGTGHGVGLAIHEAPAVAATSRDRLVDGMALTVEPGVYFPGLGGVRIEDTIVVTAGGPARTLTEFPHELHVL